MAWLENISLGMLGGELYEIIDKTLPKASYHWHLNPGHFVADEEWMSSSRLYLIKEEHQDLSLFLIH